MRHGLQTGLQCADLDSEGVAGDLHKLAQRRNRETDRGGDTRHAFVANHADFDGFAVFGGDEKRNQSAIWKISKFQFLCRLVENFVLAEMERLQVRKHDAIFGFGNGQKDFVAKNNRLSIRGASRMRTSASYVGRQCHSVLCEVGECSD